MIYGALIFVALFILFVPFIRLGGGYYRSLLFIFCKDYIYCGGGWIRLFPDIPYLRLVKWANPIWFRYVAGGYGRDQRYVYVEGHGIEGSDPRTFRQIGTAFKEGQDREYYYADSRTVRRGSVLLMKVPDDGQTPVNFDTGSFQPLGAGFVRDNTGVYHLSGRSHEQLSEWLRHARSAQVIFLAEKVEIVDPPTFRVTHLSRMRCTAADENFTYNILSFNYRGSIEVARDGVLEIADVVGEKSFRDLGCRYYLTSFGVFFSEKRLLDADADSFQVIAVEYNRHCYPYAKDKNRVYFRSKLLDGADPETFQIIATAPFYSFDAQNRYSQGNLISALAEPLAQSEQSNFEQAYDSWKKNEFKP